jgi:23S rRNA (cytosine1962-C5)-methyltransferase
MPPPAASAQPALMAGSVPEPHVVSEDGARYLRACAARAEPRPVPGHGRRPPLGAAPRRRQHPGLRCSTCSPTPARSRWWRCGGAAQVVNVDMARARWPPASRTTGSTAGGPAPFLAHDMFHSWGKLTRMAPTTWSSWTRPATRRAASSPPRTTPPAAPPARPAGTRRPRPAVPERPRTGRAPSCASRCKTQAPTLQFVERLANPAGLCRRPARAGAQGAGVPGGGVSACESQRRLRLGTQWGTEVLATYPMKIS